MIVNARNRGKVELRTVEWGSSAIPMPNYGAGIYSGVRVDTERTLGLSAVGAAVRLIALLIASMDLRVFTGSGADKRATETAWQDKLLADPNPEQSQFDLLSDIVTGPETQGNALVLKVKHLITGRPVALIPLDMSYASIRRDRDTKEKIIEIIVDGQMQRYSPSEVLHFRGWTVAGKVSGYSPIQLHRQALGTALALEEFEGRFFAQSAQPPGAIKVPGNVKRARALEILDVWEATHGGLQNAHRPGMLTNGAEWQSIGINLQDAQFIQAKAYGVQQVAQIWGIPPELLGQVLSRPEPTEQIGLRLLNFSIMPRLRRIERTFGNDPDLFGDGTYPEFVTDAILRLDAVSAAQVQVDQVQAGLRLVDELRAQDGLSPLPPVPADWTQEPGKVPQITPVGGAPNPTADTGASLNGKNPASSEPAPARTLAPSNGRH